jgi:hypothetical protein
MNRISLINMPLVVIVLFCYFYFGKLIGIPLGIIILFGWYKIHTYLDNRPDYKDHRGYMRNGWKDLIHRNVAYKHHYDRNKFRMPFSKYDVHHKDQNKLNNSPKNLQILTRKQHDAIHRKLRRYKNKYY